MAADLALGAFCLAFPAMILLVKERVAFFSKWSPLIVCYAAGLVLGNLGILLHRLRRFDEAEEAYRRTLALQPGV